MKIEILGSGGATLTPRPFSKTRVSQTAIERGLPYSRCGPSYFIHDLNLLIDTPEDIAQMLIRSQINQVSSVFYSHWHPDHTKGMRVFEANLHIPTWPQTCDCTMVYLPEKVADDFRTRLALQDQLDYLEDLGAIQKHIIPDGTSITLNNITIQPILLEVGYVYAFLLSDGVQNILIAPDELFAWQPPDSLPPLDLAILPMGIVEFDLFTGERLIHADHPILQSEATVAHTLELARKLQPRQTILSHIEEPEPYTYDDYLRFAELLKKDHYPPISFAYDQQLIEVIS